MARNYNLRENNFDPATTYTSKGVNFEKSFLLYIVGTYTYYKKIQMWNQ